MRNVALVLEYDGGMFHGWQSQTNAATVQDAVARAIAKLEGLPPRRFTGASRTDAGVHARAQVANFFTESRIPADKYAYALNALFPRGVACVRSAEAPPGFQARYSAVSKTYTYLILNRRMPSALYGDRAWHVPLPLDAGAMRDAAALIVGERDFRAFMSTGSPVKSTIRNVTRLDLDDRRPAREPFIKISVEGDGFLYNMVRIIAGTLVYAGLGRLGPGDVETALASGDRKAAGKTAPPQGLCLESVSYGAELDRIIYGADD